MLKYKEYSKIICCICNIKKFRNEFYKDSNMDDNICHSCKKTPLIILKYNKYK